jgi:hypothetical protein
MYLSILNYSDDTYHLNASLTTLYHFAFKHLCSKVPETTDKSSCKSTITGQNPDVILEAIIRMYSVSLLNLDPRGPRGFSQKKQRRIAHRTAMGQTHATAAHHFVASTTVHFTADPLTIQKPQQHFGQQIPSSPSR